MSEVARVDYHFDALIGRRQFAKDAQRIVSRCVVDEQEVERVLACQRLRYGIDPIVQFSQIALFVVAGHHDGYATHWTALEGWCAAGQALLLTAAQDPEPTEALGLRLFSATGNAPIRT